MPVGGSPSRRGLLGGGSPWQGVVKVSDCIAEEGCLLLGGSPWGGSLLGGEVSFLGGLLLGGSPWLGGASLGGWQYPSMH